MTTRQIRDTLAELVRHQARLGPLPAPGQVNSIAQEILSLQPRVGIPAFNKNDPSFQTQDPRGPSAINRLIDVLSRPLYGVLNPIKEGLEGDIEDVGDVFNAIGRGVAGKDKTLGSDVLEAGNVENPVARGILGFGLDIAADPLTYLGVGLARNLGKGISKSVEALGSVEKGSQDAARQIAADVERAAAQSISKIPSRTFAAGPGPTRRAELTTGEGIPTPGPIPVAGPTPLSTIGSKLQPQDPARIFASKPEGSAVIVGTADTIGTPIPKPQTVRENLEEMLQVEREISPGRARLIERQLREIPQQPTVAGRQNVADVLRDLAKQEKSPVVKNMITQQVRKIEANVNPAETMVGQAGLPIKRPPITATPKQREAADEIANKFLRDKTFPEINPKGQSDLYDRVVTWLGKNRVPKAQRPSVALNMIRQAEENLLRSGRKLVDWEGRSLRLSDVGLVQGKLDTDVVTAFRKKKEVSQAVEVARASAATETATDVIDPVINVARKVADSVRDLPPSRTTVIQNDVVRELTSIAKAAGASKHEASKAKQFIRDLFNFQQDELYTALGLQARNMMRIVATGKNNPVAQQIVSKEVYKALGAYPRILGNDIPQHKVVEGIMTRIATHWGAKDIRPYAREFIDTARNIAAAFEQAMAPLIRATTVSQRTSAWRVAQGRLDGGTPAEIELANRFKTIVEKLVGAEGVKTNAGNSVVTRAGVTRQQLNSELARGNSKLRFRSDKGVDDFGKEFDYTGENWLNSWKEWDVNEPAEALYELTRALQMATRKNAFLDDFAYRFGMPVRKAEFNTPVAIPRLDGFYFPRELAEQLNRVWDRLENDIFFKGGKGLQTFDTMQRAWKSGVTIYSPSHHIRNLNGDIFLNMLDGVFSPRSYATATRVLMAHRRRYKDVMDATDMTDPKFRRLAATKPGDVVLKTGGGHKLTAEKLMWAMDEQGFLMRTNILEDLAGNKVPFGLPGNLRGRAHGVASAVAENRDHWVRMAHFIDLIKKDKGKNLRDVFARAGHRVKKFHPDGSDLTGFEQSVMRRLIPFYSWLRKSTPLVIEGVAMRPHVSLAFPKAMAEIQEMTGVESLGPGDPFPVDSMFPEWIKEKGIGPIIPEDNPLVGLGRQRTWQGPTPGYTIINPTSPFIDQFQEIFNPQKTLISGASPVARIPVELLTGHTALGVPLEKVKGPLASLPGGGIAQHLAQQIPPVGIGMRVSGLTRPEERWQPEQLINWLISGGLVTGTGPYEQQAQIEIREHLRKLGQENRNALR